jgi:heme-degrading monooxygenase HmoA
MIQYRGMLHIVWEFRIYIRKRKQFESHYSANGSWAKLFRKSAGFIETILIRDREMSDRYLTIDIWKDLASFKRFKKQFRAEYESLDGECEEFTLKEKCLGFFDAL